MKLKPREILSDLVEVALILRGGVKTRIQAWFSALVCIASVCTFRGECTQEVPPVIYMYVSKEKANLNTFGFFKGREIEGESLRAVFLCQP